MQVGEYRREETNKETCEECKNECPLLFKLQNKDLGTEQQVCEGCFNRYYIKHPFK